MKILVDENLSPKLAGELAAKIPGSCHVRDVGLSSAPDDIVWLYAREHGFAVMTKDTDFSHRSELFGQPPKVIRIATGNCSTRRIITLLHRRQGVLRDFLDDETKALLVIG